MHLIYYFIRTHPSAFVHFSRGCTRVAGLPLLEDCSAFLEDDALSSLDRSGCFDWFFSGCFEWFFSGCFEKN